MRYTLLLLVLLPVLCCAQVLQESSRSIGFGFSEVHRSQVNPPGSSESIGHLLFVYFGGQQLCQCAAGEFFISPSGAHALFVSEKTGSISLFNSQTKSIKALTSGFMSPIAKVEWNEPARRALIIFERGGASKPTPNTLQVSLSS